MSGRISLTKAEQRQVAAAAAVFAPWGLAWRAEMGGKHLIIRVEGPRGGVWRMQLPCTPRDADAAADHARQKAQRLVRDINGRLGL